MATAKKTVRKIPVRSVGGPAVVPVRGPIPSVGVKRKEEVKHVAVVMEIRCGHWYSRHYHYNISVAEVEADTAPSKLRKGAEEAARIISSALGKRVRVLDVQEVTIASQKNIREMLANLIATK